MEPMEPTPSDPQLIARVGHAFYDWASDLYGSGKPSAAAQMFERAVGYYDRVLAIVPEDPVVLGDRAFALHYMGNDEAREALAHFIAVAKDEPSLAAQLDIAKGLLASN